MLCKSYLNFKRYLKNCYCRKAETKTKGQGCPLPRIKYSRSMSDKIKPQWAKWATAYKRWLRSLFSLYENQKLKTSTFYTNDNKCTKMSWKFTTTQFPSSWTLKPIWNDLMQKQRKKVICTRLLDKAATFDAFNVFPRHCLKCFPFPNQQYCSVLIDLAIRCNWPSITFPSKFISVSVQNQRKGNATCQSRH